MDRSLRILHADDSISRRRMVRKALAGVAGGDSIVNIASMEDLEARLLDSDDTFIAMIGESALGGDGLAVLDVIRATRPDMPVVIAADSGREEFVVEAMRRGASDYIVAKRSGIGRLQPAIEAALEAADGAGRGVRPASETGHEPELAVAVLDALDALVVVLDDKGRIVHFNRVCEAATGYGSNEVKGRHVWDMLLPEDEIEAVKGVFGNLRAGDYPIRFENHWLTKDGDLRLIAWSNTTFVNNVDEVRYVIGTGIDITGRRRAEEKLDASETRYKVLVETMSDGLAVDDPQGHLTYVNASFCEMIGRPREELLGRRFSELVHPANRSLYEEQQERRALGTTDPYELSLLGRDGTAHEVLISPQRLVDADGRTAGSFGVITDLTNIKQVEKERTLLATAIEQAVEAVIITDADGVIQYVNPAFEESSGYPRSEAIGAKPSILKSGEHDDAYYRGLWETISAGHVWTGGFTNRRKDGSLFEEEATISPVRDEGGKIVAYVAVKRDISEERHLVQQLNRAQKLEALGQLAGGIAHDFNNLLMAITGATELLRLRLPEALRGSNELVTIRRTVARGAELARRLLSVAHQQVLEMVVLDLNKTVRQELDILGRIVPETIKIDFEPGPGLLAVRGDRGQLAQILMNLCVNARDAMPDGGLLSVTTSSVLADAFLLAAHPEASEGRYVRLTVTDSGIGMDAEVRDRVFDPFFTTKDDTKGSGLGLATVYGIVRQHGGMIELVSSPGAGSRFDIYLPATTDQPEETDSGHEHVAVGGTETILVVEDEAGVRHAQVEMLTALGYKVLEAENGRVAFHLLEREGDAIDLVLTDVTMPEMGGRELFDHARRLRPEITFVFSSGYTGDEFIEKMSDDESIHFIAKPYSLAQLAGIIRTALAEGTSKKS